MTKNVECVNMTYQSGLDFFFDIDYSGLSVLCQDDRMRHFSASIMEAAGDTRMPAAHHPFISPTDHYMK